MVLMRTIQKIRKIQESDEFENVDFDDERNDQAGEESEHNSDFKHFINRGSNENIDTLNPGHGST